MRNIDDLLTKRASFNTLRVSTDNFTKLTLRGRYDSTNKLQISFNTGKVLVHVDDQIVQVPESLSLGLCELMGTLSVELKKTENKIEAINELLKKD